MCWNDEQMEGTELGRVLKEGFLGGSDVKNPPAMQETWLDLWVGKILWRREWLPTPVFWSGEFHGQRSLAGYSPWGCKELDMMTEATFTFLKEESDTPTEGRDMKNWVGEQIQLICWLTSKHVFFYLDPLSWDPNLVWNIFPSILISNIY